MAAGIIGQVFFEAGKYGWSEEHALDSSKVTLLTSAFGLMEEYAEQRRLTLGYPCKVTYVRVSNPLKYRDAQTNEFDEPTGYNPEAYAVRENSINLEPFLCDVPQTTLLVHCQSGDRYFRQWYMGGLFDADVFVRNGTFVHQPGNAWSSGWKGLRSLLLDSPSRRFGFNAFDLESANDWRKVLVFSASDLPQSANVLVTTVDNHGLNDLDEVQIRGPRKAAFPVGRFKVRISSPASFELLGVPWSQFTGKQFLGGYYWHKLVLEFKHYDEIDRRRVITRKRGRPFVSPVGRRPCKVKSRYLPAV